MIDLTPQQIARRLEQLATVAKKFLEHSMHPPSQSPGTENKPTKIAPHE